MDGLDRKVHELAQEFIASNPLLVALGRALAPAINAEIAKMDKPAMTAPKKKLGPKDYCPGCGTIWVSDGLCTECLEFDPQQGEPSDG